MTNTKIDSVCGIMAILLLALTSSLIITQPDKNDYTIPQIKYQEKQEVAKSISSWYDYQLDGIWWSKDNLTAASRDFPKKSQLRITNIENNKSVIVRVNDYGPEEWTGRQIDLSSYAFSQLDPLTKGIINVRIELYEQK